MARVESSFNLKGKGYMTDMKLVNNIIVGIKGGGITYSECWT